MNMEIDQNVTLELLITNVIFTKENDDGSVFHIIKAKTQDNEDLTLKGSHSNKLLIEQEIIADGKFINDPKYGKQFIANFIEYKQPENSLGVFKYLSAGCVKGIGKKIAEKLLKHFGENLFTVVTKEQNRLIEVLSEKKVKTFVKQWQNISLDKASLFFLMEHNLTKQRATKICKEYGDKTISMIKENPYRLIDDFPGIGFKIADSIANKINFDMDSLDRVLAAIMFTLGENESLGNNCISSSTLSEKLIVLNINIGKNLEEALIKGVETEKLRFQEVDDIYYIYSNSQFYCEDNSANLLATKLKKKLPDYDLSTPVTQNLTDEQLSAVFMGLTNPVSVITGGAGVGKTTVIKTILHHLQTNDVSFALCAPTGRAAKRMTESTGFQGYTIHRLISQIEELKYEEQKKLGLDLHDSQLNNYTAFEYIILDESSMLDQRLLNEFLKNCGDSNLIFVGDPHQLPSIGAGNVLDDLITSGVIPVTKLTKIWRQGNGSDIIRIADDVNKGNTLKFNNTSNCILKNHKYVPKKDGEEAYQQCITNIINDLMNTINEQSNLIDPIKDLQILTPMRVSKLGIIEINKLVQELLNPIKFTKNDAGETVPEELKSFNYNFRTGDKVIQNKNNYNKQIFNGDIGYIESINIDDNSLIINFDGNKQIYENDDLSEIELAYAITIHKSQGSEYNTAIILITYHSFIMLQRNLLYTGITRGKNKVILIGQLAALNKAVSMNDATKRTCFFKLRLINYCQAI